LGFGISSDVKHVNNVRPPFYVVAIRKIRTKVAAAGLIAAMHRARSSPTLTRRMKSCDAAADEEDAAA
jgi:hypothetical protein